MTGPMQDTTPDTRLARLIARQAEKRALAEIWAREAVFAPGMTVLDIGAGTGALALIYARIVGAAGRVIALDPDAACLAHARTEAGRQGLRLVTIAGGAESLALLETAPDRVMLTDTLHHMDDPEAALRAIHAALTEKALLFIAEYDPCAPGAVGAPRTRRLPRERVRAMLETAGFAVIRAADAPDEHYIFLARPG
ncbi:MAG TPA: class I SAM-dependent methyltransferase [Acidiphilium sp.]